MTTGTLDDPLGREAKPNQRNLSLKCRFALAFCSQEEDRRDRCLATTTTTTSRRQHGPNNAGTSSSPRRCFLRILDAVLLFEKDRLRQDSPPFWIERVEPRCTFPPLGADVGRGARNSHREAGRRTPAAGIFPATKNAKKTTRSPSLARQDRTALLPSVGSSLSARPPSSPLFSFRRLLNFRNAPEREGTNEANPSLFSLP
jgi:hypothetical protein